MNFTSESFDVIVIGAGASGLMAAISAARLGKRVLVCEQGKSPGRKILASGGGRCNVTNSMPVDPFSRAFGKDKALFVKSSLKQFGQQEILTFFNERNVPLICNDGLHFYPESNKSSDVLNVMLAECRNLNITLRTKTPIIDMVYDENGIYGIQSNRQTIPVKNCIISCGGKGYPDLGGTDGGYALAKSSGHTIVPLVPGLTGLQCIDLWITSCAGITVDNGKIVVGIKNPNARSIVFDGGVLFTHTGVSGPAVLDCSATVSRMLQTEKNIEVRVLICEKTDEKIWIDRFVDWQQNTGPKMLAGHLKRYVPARLVDQLLLLCKCVPDIRCSDVSRSIRQSLIEMLTLGVRLTIKDMPGWGSAMVTSGGVALDEVDMRTLESKKVKGLYFSGEVLDCDGPCGGYNMTWAFASGWVAGLNAAGCP